MPEPLAVLARLAYNYRWAWMPGGSDLFRSIDPRAGAWSAAIRSACCRRRPPRRWPRGGQRRAAGARRGARGGASAADLGRRGVAVPSAREHPVAFFCAEFAVHQSLPIYSGGLGALAGDILKEASDRALPMVAIGLMYRRGYFRQRIDHSGWQQEYWVLTDPERLPARWSSGDDGEPLRSGADRRRRTSTRRSGASTSAASRCS